jgi:hypothetical protein
VEVPASREGAAGLARRAGRLHSLRHYSATELIAAGTDVRTVAGRLGHGSGGATTQRFTPPGSMRRVSGPRLPPDLFRERGEGQHVGPGGVEVGRDRGELAGQGVGSHRPGTGPV